MAVSNRHAGFDRIAQRDRLRHRRNLHFILKPGGKVLEICKCASAITRFVANCHDQPDDVFAGLKSLKVLELGNTTMTRLPKSLLTLPKIEVIYYNGNGMSKEDYETLKKEYGDKLKARREPPTKP